MNRLILVIAVAGLVSLSSLVYVISRDMSQSGPNHNNATAVPTSIPNTFYLAMNIVPTNRLVPMGGNANFSIVLYNGGDLNGTYSLSALAPPGLQVAFGPDPIAISGAGPHFGNMTVQSSSGINQGNYNVTIVAKGSRGVANQTFGFYLQRNLILLTGVAHSVTLAFSNLTLKAGDNLTWMSLDPPMSDEVDTAYHQVFLLSVLLNINSTSDHMQQYAGWSYTFKQPGVYQWYDSVNPSVRGEVIVTP